MKLVKSIAIGSLLLGFMSSVYAEGGSERVEQFKQEFLAEQARLWNDESAEQQQQQVAAEQEQERPDFKEGTNNQAAVTKDIE